MSQQVARKSQNIISTIGRSPLAGFLGRLVDLCLSLRVDRRQRALVDACREQALPVALHGVAAQPLPHLRLGPVPGRVGARVSTVAVGKGFNERRSLSGAGLSDSFYGRVVH